MLRWMLVYSYDDEPDETDGHLFEDEQAANDAADADRADRTSSHVYVAQVDYGPDAEYARDAAIATAAREYLRLETLYHTTRRVDVNVLMGQAHDALVAAVKEGK